MNNDVMDAFNASNLSLKNIRLMLLIMGVGHTLVALFFITLFVREAFL